MSASCSYCGRIFTRHGMSNHQNACHVKKHQEAKEHRAEGYKAVTSILQRPSPPSVVNNNYTTVIVNNNTLIIQNTINICGQIDRKMEDFLINATNFLRTIAPKYAGQDRHQLMARDLEKYIERVGDNNDKEIMRLIVGKEGEGFDIEGEANDIEVEKHIEKGVEQVKIALEQKVNEI